MVFDFFLLLILVCCSACFSCMETAYFSLSEVDKEVFQHSRSARCRKIYYLLERKEHLLCTILISNNLVNIAASAFNTVLAVQYAAALGLGEESAVVIFVFALTIVILVFGEIIPKSIALTHNVFIAKYTAPVMVIFLKLMYPLTIVLRRLLDIFSAKDTPNSAAGDISHMRKVLTHYGKKHLQDDSKVIDLLENVLDFKQRSVSAIVTPRTSVFALPDDTEPEKAFQLMTEKNFSRVPLYSESIDNITGVLHFKEVARSYFEKENIDRLGDLADKPIFVYETLSIFVLLERMKQKQAHISFVVDEFGGLVGLVTLEDILEELVGDILDEKDSAVPISFKVDEHTWSFSGKAYIHTVNRETGLNIAESDDYDTLQGWIMSELEHLPRFLDTVEYNGYVVTVKQMRGNEIHTAQVELDLSAQPNPKEGVDRV